ncbi:Lysosomal acid phosphatase [Balamuthia mandrillaris]
MPFKAAALLLFLWVGVASVTATAKGSRLLQNNYDYCQAPLPQYVPLPQEVVRGRSAELLHVQLITRHGDRSPANILPHEDVEWNCDTTGLVALDGVLGPPPGGSLTGSTYIKNINLVSNLPFSQGMWSGNCSAGQLTSEGAMQHYVMGKRLRQIYITQLGFLPSQYNASQVFVRSTDVWRTEQSAQANLLGLYPPDTRTSTSRDSSGIPIYVRPNPVENMVENPTLCPRVAAILNNKTQSDEWLAHQKAMNNIRLKCNKVCDTGDLASWNNAWDHFSDNFHCRTCHKKPLPCKQGLCITSSDAEQIFKEASWERDFLYQTDRELMRIAIGEFVGELLSLMNRTANGDATVPKYAFFSGHDTTISYLLGAFRQDTKEEIRWPPYASNIIFELWRVQNDSLYVRWIYNGQVLPIRGCGASDELCPWSQFLSHTLKETVLDHSNYRQLCF